MDYTSLGLGGTPRSGVLYDDLVQGPSRPEDGQFTELGLSGGPRLPQSFDDKAPGSIPPRPDGDYTELGLGGTPYVVRDFTAKSASRGIAGSISLSVTMSATLAIGRRYYTTTNLVLGVRPMGSVITVAHTNRVTGSLRITVRPQAGLRYTRYGSSNAIQGNASIQLTPFGNVKYRAWRHLSGMCPVKVTPAALMTYTPAPVRHHHVSGSARVRVTATSSITHEAHGVAYTVAGGTSVKVTMKGTVSVVRQTTYSMAGRINLSVTPHGIVTWTTGLPQAYHVNGSVSVSVTPVGRMGKVIGAQQYAAIGNVRYSVKPSSRITVTRAPTVTPLDGRKGRRRFIRIFR